MPKRSFGISSQLFSITTLLRYGLTSKFNNFFHFRNKVPNKSISKSKTSLQNNIIMPSYEGYNTQTQSEQPDKNCRTCSDFRFWSKQQQRQLSGKLTDDAGPTKATDVNQKSSAGTTSSDDSVLKPQRADCPLDKSTLGSSTWGLLHTIAAFFPDEPTCEQKQQVKTFFDSLSKVYPCDYCARDFRKDLKENPVNVDNQKELSMWLCKFHNRVNKKLGKPEFDCSKINERWRDGWADGSCD